MIAFESVESAAAALNGREYKQEMTAAERQAAADAGLVIIFGHSDDTTVIAGAIEASCETKDGGTFYLNREDGLFEDCPCDCVHSRRAKARAKAVEVRWCKGPYVWSYRTDIPHATFEIRDNQPSSDNLRFCQGLVFRMADLQ
jgi:hypothetical protein